MNEVTTLVGLAVAAVGVAGLFFVVRSLRIPDDYAEKRRRREEYRKNQIVDQYERNRYKASLARRDNGTPPAETEETAE